MSAETANDISTDDNETDDNITVVENKNDASKKIKTNDNIKGDTQKESIPESTNSEGDEISVVLPDEKEVFDNLSLNSFYYNTLFRVGQSGAINTLDSFSTTSIRCQMTISFSGAEILWLCFSGIKNSSPSFPNRVSSPIIIFGLPFITLQNSSR